MDQRNVSLFLCRKEDRSLLGEGPVPRGTKDAGDPGVRSQDVVVEGVGKCGESEWKRKEEGNVYLHTFIRRKRLYRVRPTGGDHPRIRTRSRPWATQTTSPEDGRRPRRERFQWVPKVQRCVLPVKSGIDRPEKRRKL